MRIFGNFMGPEGKINMRGRPGKSVWLMTWYHLIQQDRAVGKTRTPVRPAVSWHAQQESREHRVAG